MGVTWYMEEDTFLLNFLATFTFTKISVSACVMPVLRYTFCILYQHICFLKRKSAFNLRVYKSNMADAVREKDTLIIMFSNYIITFYVAISFIYIVNISFTREFSQTGKLKVTAKMFRKHFSDSVRQNKHNVYVVKKSPFCPLFKFFPKSFRLIRY